MTPNEKTIAQFLELSQRFVRLRPQFILPEPIVRFKQQMEKLRSSSAEGKTEERGPWYRVFVFLAQSETPPTMGELSAGLGVPLSTATRLVDWLVAGEFVERINDPNDRRTVRIRMTASGKQIYQSFIDFNKQRIAHVLQGFTRAEQGQMLQLMHRLLDVLQAEKKL